MANLAKLSAILTLFFFYLVALVPAFPQRFNFIQRSPFSRNFRSFSRPSFRSSFRDFSDEDSDDHSSFRHFGNFGSSRNFRSSNRFGRPRVFSRSRFSNPFIFRRRSFFDSDDSFEHDD